MRVRAIITGGGTGGHVYPALSIIEQLIAPDPPRLREESPSAADFTSNEAPSSAGEGRASLAYIGSASGLERSIVPRTGIDCYLLSMAPPRSLRGLALTFAATVRSLRIIRKLRPSATVATGGFVSAPVAIASWLLRVPVILFLPDVVPGKAVKFLAPLARRIAVSTAGACAYLPRRKTVVTGYPVREEFRDASRESGRSRFDLPAEAHVVCVFGGSQGSRSLNEALARHLPLLLDRYYVVHVCGEKRLAEAQAAAGSLTSLQRERYRLFPYLHDREMAEAMASADLVVCRSGASTLGELPAIGTPAILVPLPERRVHQAENAAYLAEAGAGMIVPDHEIGDRLPAEINAILDDVDRLGRMRAASHALARPDAAARIAGLIAEVVA